MMTENTGQRYEVIALMLAMLLAGCGKGAASGSDDTDSTAAGQSSDTDLNVGTDGDTDGDADGDTDTDSDGDTDTDADGDTDTDSDGDSDGDTDTDSDSDTDGDSDGDTDTDSDGDTDTDTDGDVDGDADGDADTDVPLCEQWATDLTDETWWTANAYGFDNSSTIFSGTIGETLIDDNPDDEYLSVAVIVDEVYFGWGHFEGATVAVDIHEKRLDELGDATAVIFGVSRWAPLDTGDTPAARFDKVYAAIPASTADRFDDRLTYHATERDWIGIARMTHMDEERQYWEVVETLAGDPIDPFWHVFRQYDGVASPTDTETEYLIAADHDDPLQPNYDPNHLEIFDCREATDARRTATVEGLANPPTPIGASDAVESSIIAWWFSREDHVLTTEISGIAHDLITGAGGTFYAYDVIEPLRGGDDVTRLAQELHGEYPGWPCGDRRIMAFETLYPVTDDQLAQYFDCDEQSDLPIITEVDFSFPVLDLSATDAQIAEVRTALESAEPLYRLYNPDEIIDPADFPDDDAVTMWSRPFDIDSALGSTAALVRITVEAVVDHGDWREVEITSDLGRYGWEPYHLKLAFPCADKRLLEEGTEWKAALVGESWNLAEGEPIPERKFFFLPGVLFPVYFNRV